jgi:hypothetical protein
VQVDSLIAENAQELSRIHKIKPPDAIHIATAIKRKADIMHSYDNAKPYSPLRFNGKIGNPPLEISKPKFLDPQLLLDLKADDARHPA